MALKFLLTKFDFLKYLKNKKSFAEDFDVLNSFGKQDQRILK